MTEYEKSELSALGPAELADLLYDRGWASACEDDERPHTILVEIPAWHDRPEVRIYLAQSADGARYVGVAPAIELDSRPLFDLAQVVAFLEDARAAQVTPTSTSSSTLNHGPHRTRTWL